MGASSYPPSCAPAAGAALLGPGGRILFLCAAAYLVAPLLDLPYWGLSLSTPLVVLLLVEVALRDGLGVLREFFAWIALGLAIWLGQFLSVGVNVFAGHWAAGEPSAFVWLVKYALWIGVFVLSAVVVARLAVGSRLARVLAGAVIVLALLRVGEGVIWGAVGNAKAVMLQQNHYGWAFSSFCPFAVWLALAGSPRERWAGRAGLLILALAVAVNSSRASWVAVLFGVGVTVACLLLWSVKLRAKAALLVCCTIVGIGISWIVLPSTWRGPVEQRWSTFSRMDRDKSFAVRKLMTQKAMRLFEHSPWFGIGVGRFRLESAPLELPPVLRYRSLEGYQRRSAHNAYLGLLAQSGVAGAAPVAALLLTLAGSGIWAVRGHVLRGETWAVPIFAGFLAMCLHLTMLSGITNTATWFVFGLVAGLIHRQVVAAAARRYSPLTSRPRASHGSRGSG